MSVQLVIYGIMCLMCSLLWPYLFCHYGTIITNELSSIGDILYTSNWYNYSAVYRHHITLIIVCSQKPIAFTGLGLITCSLESFGKVSISINLFFACH